MRCLRRRLRCLRADPAQPTLFDDGVESPAADGERFYDDDYREAWRAIVLADIARTASVRLDRLTHRVARAHGLNANVVFHWRREYRDGKLAAAGLVPVVVTGDFLPERQRTSESTSSIRIDLPGGAVISVEGNADLALIRTIVESLRA